MKIGIDFGTCFSSPACLESGRPIVLLPNNEYAIPSLFYYDSEDGIKIGKDAEDCYNPNNLVRYIKMEISNENFLFVADNRRFTKKDIIYNILNKVIQTAKAESERRELKSQSIDGVVISVPAAFTLREKQYIKEAAELININGTPLNVLGFIPEPVAAAIAYFNAPAAEDNKTILVYDLGGGTCDVALVKADSTAATWYKVMRSGMKRIGGRDWDNALMQIIEGKLRKVCKENNNEYDDIVHNNEHYSDDLRKIAIMLKHRLSDNVAARSLSLAGGQLRGVLVSREEFEDATRPLLNKTMDLVKEVIGNNLADIDYIVCVGGSSNMPQIANEFKRRFPDKTVKVFEPEKAIAFGAAIYANNISDKNFVQDICKFSYGAEYVQDYYKYHDKNRTRIFNIILKDTELPAKGVSHSSKLSDGSSIYIPIYESDCTDGIYELKEGTYIGDITISGIPDGKKGDDTKLTMEIDRSGLMVLHAEHVKSGKSAHVEIKLKGYGNG